MKVSATFFAFVASAIAVVEASRFDAGASLAARANHIARSSLTQPARVANRSLGKRCSARTPPKAGSNNNNAAAPVSNAASAPPTNNLISVQSSCGATGATAAVTATSGPNGSLDWFNCGLTSGGWNPPYIRVQDAIYVDFGAALSAPNSAFAACAPYANWFEQYAGENNIPAILLASFAMQESGCVPWTVGGDGSQGLMQLTSDKCGAAPGGDCTDPEFNIRTGAAYFASVLSGNGGDLLRSIGQYNGWIKGMTYNEATAAQWTGCCRCQNNLDYLQQFMNGWLQNVNAYSHQPPLGSYFNLAVCVPS